MTSQPKSQGGGPNPPKVRLRPAKLITRQSVDYEAAFQQLEMAINQIYQLRQSTLRFEECYRNAYNLVRANQATQLHHRVLKAIGINLTQLYQIHLKPFYRNIKLYPTGPDLTPLDGVDDLGSHDGKVVVEAPALEVVHPETFNNTDQPFSVETSDLGLAFLKALITIWDRHLISLPKITSILCYLDNHLNQHATETCRPITHDGPLQFYDKVLQTDGAWANANLTLAVLNQIDFERRGGLVNRGVIKSIVSMLLMLKDGAYEELLERPYLVATRAFYELEFSKLVEVASSREVLNRVDQRLMEEAERCTNHLTTKTLPKALNIIYENVVVRFAKPIAEVRALKRLRVQKLWSRFKLNRNFNSGASETFPVGGLA